MKIEVEYIFDAYVTSINPTDSEVYVTVTFANTTSQRKLNLLIAADGLSPPTPPDADQSRTHSLDQYIYLFSISHHDSHELRTN